MAVHIRLRRIGKRPKKRPYFRVTAFDERRARDSRVLEELGSYNPVTGASTLKIEKINHWIEKGAVLSNTVRSLVKKAKKG